MLKLNKKKSGFTVVELLVVIVVIAILAAITIVSYTGISSRANDSALKSDLSNASKVLKLYYAEYGTYPASVSETTPGSNTYCTSDPDYCYKSSSSNVVLDYMYAPNNFILTALINSNTSYYITANSLTPTTGGRNLLYLTNSDNTSFEGTGIGDWQYWKFSTPTASTDTSFHGLKSMKGVVNAEPWNSTFVLETIGLIKSGTYTASAYVKTGSDSALGKNMWIFMYGNNSGPSYSSNVVLTTNWQRVTLTKLFNESDTITSVQIGYHGNISAIGEIIYMDAIQLETGNTATAFY